MNAGSSKPSQFSSMARQSSHETLVQLPYVEIVEQPRAGGLSYQYEREERLACSLHGETSTPDREMFPTIKIHNYSGPGAVLVSCVTKGIPCEPHPHNLVGKDCTKGVCTLRFRDTNVVSFRRLAIQFAKTEDVEEQLKIRQDIKVDPFQTGFNHKGRHIDLNVVRLCFQLFLPDEHGNITRKVPPVVSKAIQLDTDKKHRSLKQPPLDDLLLPPSSIEVSSDNTSSSSEDMEHLVWKSDTDKKHRSLKQPSLDDLLLSLSPIEVSSDNTSSSSEDMEHLVWKSDTAKEKSITAKQQLNNSLERGNKGLEQEKKAKEKSITAIKQLKNSLEQGMKRLEQEEKAKEKSITAKQQLKNSLELGNKRLEQEKKEPVHIPQAMRWKDERHLVGVVSGRGIPDQPVRATNYVACEDCGRKIDGEGRPRKVGACDCGGGSTRDRSLPSELSVDPRFLSLYEEALKSGQNKDCSIRVNVVGNYKQGKTTLVRRLISKNVDNVESTNGINVDKYICKRNANVEKKSLTKSTENLRTSDSSGHCSSSVSAKKVEKTAKESEYPLAVHFWDFGGQYVFYATHTLFHSSKAVYILVFDLSTDLSAVVKDEEFPADTLADRNMEYFARFWMNSIHSCVGSADGSEPPVFIVGTHMDKLHGTYEEKRHQADKYFENVRHLFDDTQVMCHILPMDFAVDNTDPFDKETEQLREEIFHTGFSRAELYDIPARWIPLIDSLKNKQYLRIIPFEAVVETDARNHFPVEDETQIKLFLQYHHAKGTLIYFDEDTLSDYVVLDVQYLIDAFKCLITSERFCRKDTDIRPFWKKLMSEGKLETNLIDAVWSRDAENNFMTHKNILLQYLKRHHIISEALQYDESTGETKEMGWFIVPSLLTCPINKEELKDFLNGKQQTAIRLVIVFPNSCIVHNFYHRLLAAALGRWPVAHIACKTLLYQNLCVFLLREDQAGIAEINGENIDLRVVNLCLSTPIDKTVADQFRRFADSFVEHEFKNIREHDGGNKTLNRQNKTQLTIQEGALFQVNSTEWSKPHMSSYRCNHESHVVNGSTKLESLEKWRDKKVMPCPDHLTHEIDVRLARSEWFQKDGITGTVSDTTLSDKHLSKIAQAIGRNWEYLGDSLGLKTVEIDHICMDNERTVMRIFEMLKVWQSRNGDNATLRVLVYAMNKCQRVNIDWDKIRNLIDELK